MALSSPGVQVTVVDESFYTPAEAGTTPLIIVATAQDKTNASGTGTAQGTTKANAGKAYKVTSQRDLVDLFGVPTFTRTSSGSPVHGGEQNEYGLQAAYSLMGVTNSAWIVRADVNLTDIAAKAAAPGSNPLDGQWWLDTTNSTYGIFEWNGGAKIDGGQSFANKKPIVLTVDDADKLEDTNDYGWAPKSSVGVTGDYAVVTYTSMIRVFFNKRIVNPTTAAVSNEWVLVGSNGWKSAWPTVTSTSNVTVANTGQFSINGTLVSNPGTSLQSLVTKINQLAITGVTALGVNGRLQLFTTGQSAGNTITLAAGSGVGVTDLLATIGMTAGVYNGPELQMSAHTSVPPFKIASDDRPTGSVWIKTTEPNLGARWRVKRWNGATLAWVEQTAPLLEKPQSAIYSLDKAGGGRSIPTNTVFAQYNAEEDTGNDLTPQTATFKLYKRVNAGAATIITSKTVAGAINAQPAGNVINVQESLKGQEALSAIVNVTLGELFGDARDADAIATAFGVSGFYSFLFSY